jgi:hypothetical protein
MCSSDIRAFLLLPIFAVGTESSEHASRQSLRHPFLSLQSFVLLRESPPVLYYFPPRISHSRPEYRAALLALLANLASESSCVKQFCTDDHAAVLFELSYDPDALVELPLFSPTLPQLTRIGLPTSHGARRAPRQQFCMPGCPHPSRHGYPCRSDPQRPCFINGTYLPLPLPLHLFVSFLSNSLLYLK